MAKNNFNINEWVNIILFYLFLFFKQEVRKRESIRIFPLQNMSKYA